MPPSSWSQSAATTALRKVHSQLFRVKRLREIPHWWILGRCGPPNTGWIARRACGGDSQRREGCPPLPHHLVCVEKFTPYLTYLTLLPPHPVLCKAVFLRKGARQRRLPYLKWM